MDTDADQCHVIQGPWMHDVERPGVQSLVVAQIRDSGIDILELGQRPSSGSGDNVQALRHLIP